MEEMAMPEELSTRDVFQRRGVMTDSSGAQQS